MGPKGVGDALDQLLSYLVWRDSKAALVMFIGTADPRATIQKLHDAVEAHVSWALTKDAANPSSRVDYVVTADDEGRRVSLAVIPGGYPAPRLVSYRGASHRPYRPRVTTFSADELVASPWQRGRPFWAVGRIRSSAN
jgi:hypothetical protein